MKEYDVYLPTRGKDGSLVPAAVIDHVKCDLRDRFGGCTHFSHPNEGHWKMGGIVFVEGVTVLRVISEGAEQDFFKELKEHLKTSLGQEDVLIVEREVRLL